MPDAPVDATPVAPDAPVDATPVAPDAPVVPVLGVVSTELLDGDIVKATFSDGTYIEFPL